MKSTIINKESNYSLHNLEKNIGIWKKVGKNVCDYWTSNSNVIYYEEFNSANLTKTHLIFLLDDSGSVLFFIFRIYA